jgi:hypothetical protein
MTVSINWATKRITVPQADLTFISGALYDLDIDVLRLNLKNIEDSEEGMPHPDTHRHNTEVVLSGVTYARTFEIINGYTLDFQDTGSPYTVRCGGANHNLADVFVPGTTEVSLIIGNSAGLISVTSGSGLSTAQDERLTRIEKWLRNKQILNPANGARTVYDDDNSTPLGSGTAYSDVAGTTPYDGTGPVHRTDRLA